MGFLDLVHTCFRGLVQSVIRDRIDGGSVNVRAHENVGRLDLA